MPAASRFAQGFGGQVRREPTPETEQAVRRREDDDEENQSDQGVEPICADNVDREGLQEHIERRAYERPDGMAKAADDRDHENADHFARADSPGRYPVR